MSKINFYEFVKKEKTINPNYALHGINIPFRMLIAAPSGSGKTNALFNLLTHLDKTFHEIIICVKSADEPLYNMLIEKLKNIVVYENGEVPDLKNYSKLDEETGRLKRIDKKLKRPWWQWLLLAATVVSVAAVVAKKYWLVGKKQ